VPAHVAHLLAFYFAVLSEVSPPVGLSPSAAAAVTGGNPFRAMMHAWKYSLPAFLVPFFFSATAVGASLLILEATTWNFVIAVFTSVAALFFLALGIVGQFRVSLHWIERALLIASAAAMAVHPVSLSLEGLLPFLCAAGIVFRNLWLSRRLHGTERTRGFG
jgi:TRAP-type uncharacterized transport system fused permease subunit